MIKLFKKAWNSNRPYTWGDITKGCVISLIIYAIMGIAWWIYLSWDSIKEIPSRIKKRFDWASQFEAKELEEEKFIVE